MTMNISALFLLGVIGAPLSNAWMASTTNTLWSTSTSSTPSIGRSTRLMMKSVPQPLPADNDRRAFFRQVGALVGTTATIVAGPWIARADDSSVVEPESSSSSSSSSPTSDDAMLVASDEAVMTTTEEKSATVAAEQVLVADDEMKQQSDEPSDVMEASFVQNSPEAEAAVELNAKIEESMQAAESSSSAAELMLAEERQEEPVFAVASVDPDKIYQDLFDERKAVSSDAELDIFCKKLRGLIAADSNFADSFEVFLDKMSTARA